MQQVWSRITSNYDYCVDRVPEVTTARESRTTLWSPVGSAEAVLEIYRDTPFPADEKVLDSITLPNRACRTGLKTILNTINNFVYHFYRDWLNCPDLLYV